MARVGRRAVQELFFVKITMAMAVSRRHGNLFHCSQQIFHFLYWYEYHTSVSAHSTHGTDKTQLMTAHFGRKHNVKSNDHCVRLKFFKFA